MSGMIKSLTDIIPDMFNGLHIRRTSPLWMKMNKSCTEEGFFIQGSMCTVIGLMKYFVQPPRSRINTSIKNQFFDQESTLHAATTITSKSPHTSWQGIMKVLNVRLDSSISYSLYLMSNFSCTLCSEL